MRIVIAILVFSLAISSWSEMPSRDEYLSALKVNAFSEFQKVLDPLLQRTFECQPKGNLPLSSEMMEGITDHLLTFRICLGDVEYGSQLRKMEYYLRLFLDYVDPAKKKKYFKSLSEYLADERTMDMLGHQEFMNAKAMDEELIRTGKIERPVVFINRAVTPNLRAFGDRNAKIRNWNIAIQKHRVQVLSLHARAVSKYLTTLNKTDSEQFINDFSTAARLTSLEKETLFKMQKNEKK